MDNKMTRIGVFYDGNYFSKVNQYYNYVHPRKTRLSIAGLHNFIREKVAKEEQEDKKFCQIVESHYFCGRRPAKLATPEQLLSERIFEDILSREGVIPHHLPLRSNGVTEYEKGIDVWLALEAFEQAHQNRFNVLVLIAGDGDYLPLVRKINALGIRVLLLSWNFEYTTTSGDIRYTSTSEALLREATYPYAMTEVIDSVASKYDPVINGLFVSKHERSYAHHYHRPPSLPVQRVVDKIDKESPTNETTGNNAVELLEEVVAKEANEVGREQVAAPAAVQETTTPEAAKADATNASANTLAAELATTATEPISTAAKEAEGDTQDAVDKEEDEKKNKEKATQTFAISTTKADPSLLLPSGPSYMSDYAEKVKVTVSDIFEGEILFYNEEKAYGFIAHPLYPNNLYFGYRDILADSEDEKYFLKGDKVQFKIRLNPLTQFSDVVAFDVELLEEAPQVEE